LRQRRALQDREASPHGEEEEDSDAAADLKATRADVLVGHTVAREVKDRPEKECRESRSLAAPAAAPFATWSATITAAFLTDVRRARLKPPVECKMGTKVALAT